MATTITAGVRSLQVRIDRSAAARSSRFDRRNIGSASARLIGLRNEFRETSSSAFAIGPQRPEPAGSQLDRPPHPSVSKAVSSRRSRRLATGATTTVWRSRRPELVATATAMAATTATRTIAAAIVTALGSRRLSSREVQRGGALGSIPARLCLFGPSGYRLRGRPGGRTSTNSEEDSPAMAITPLMPVYPRSPVRPVRGEGVYLYGEQRREVSRFRGGHCGQHAGPRPPASDQGDPGAGGDT